MDARLRAVCDLMVPEAREFAGLHDYDGQVQDLSPDGVRRGLAALGNGPPLAHPHDEAHLAAFEQLHRVGLGELELHRRNVLPHLANLDLASYDKDYAAAAERAAARTGHLARWPAAVDAALAALDRLSAPVAGALTAEVIAYTRAPLGAAHRRRVSGGAVAGIPALGDGPAHPGRTGGAGRAVVLLRHPAR